jgi:phosphonate transport system substrate-binding protein
MFRHVLILFTFSFAVCAQTPAELQFGILSTESSQNLKPHWEPILADMSRTIGMPVKAYFAPDYAGIIEAMRFNKLQVAWLGNKPAIEAVDRANAEVFAQMLYADGAPGYYSLLIVHRDSPIRTIQDLFKENAKWVFGSGDPNSTSGTVVPGYYLFAQNGIDPRKHFKAFRNASHETNFLAVVHRQVDAATVSSEILQRFEERDPARVHEVRVVWRSPLIANDPLAWRKDLAEPVKAKVREFWLGYGKAAQEKANLKPLLAGGFRESSDLQLVPYRQLDLFREKAKIEADTTLSAEARQERLAAISRKMEALSRQLAAAN